MHLEFCLICAKIVLCKPGVAFESCALDVSTFA